MKKKIYQIYFGKGSYNLFSKCFLAGIFLLFHFSVSAQQRVISGTVTGEGNSVIPGVSVIASGTSLGTITDLQGNFSISVPVSVNALIFSFVGMETLELTLDARDTYHVILKESTVALEEVLVVGYGTQKKASVVGAITQIDNQALVESGAINVTNAIAGKLSGVLTIQSSGQPGKDKSEIIIRGLSSWNTSVPLVLVDGVERDFTDLDPYEIQTISVLKDASATAVFGAKGANGVIIVTTKRGTLGKPKLNFSASYGIEKPMQLPDHVDSYTTMSMMNVGMKNLQIWNEIWPDYILEEYRNPSTPLNALRYPDVNWFEVVTKPSAPSSKANLSIQGGTKAVKYFSMLGFNHRGSFFKGFKDGYLDSHFWHNRFHYRSNLDFSLTETTLFSVNLGGEIGYRNETLVNMWPYLYATGTARYPKYFPEWVLEQVPDPDYPNDTGIRQASTLGDYYGNPYRSLVNGSFYRYRDSKLFTDLILDQKLDFILKGLSAKGKVSLSTFYQDLSLSSGYTLPLYELRYENIGTSKNPWFRIDQTDEVWKMNPPTIGVGGLQGGFYKDLYYEMSLNYMNSFGNHNLTALALMNRQEKNIETQFPYYNEGLVGRVTYDYLRKYLFEFNLGYTGSERFAPKNRFGFFPSVAFGWVISEESFFQNAFPWINTMKLRYSDGLVGSDYAATRWLYISDYYTDSKGYIHEGAAANVSAQWEEAHKRDIGLEMRFFQNSLHFSIDLFDEHRSKMLISPNNVTMMVGSDFKELNKGKLKKHGLELELGYNNQTASGIRYFISGIFGFNENRIIDVDDLRYSPEYRKQAGKPLGAIGGGASLTGTGYYTTIDDIHNNPSPLGVTGVFIGEYKYLDFNGDGQITSEDPHPIPGLTYAPITYSFSGGFSYKGFDLKFMFMGNAKKHMSVGQSFFQEFYFGNWRVQPELVNYWRPDNQDNPSHSSLHYNGINSTNLLTIFRYGSIDGKHVMRSDYFRLKELYAGYTFNLNFMERVAGVSRINVFIIGNNLWTKSKFKRCDPDRKNINTDEGYYPLMGSGQIGLTLDF